MKKILIFLLLLLPCACSYHGSLGKNFHSPKTYITDQNIPLKVALIQNNTIRTQQFHMVHGSRSREFNIDLCPNLTVKLHQELSRIFDDVQLVDFLAQTKNAQIVVEPEFKSSFANYTRSDKEDVTNQLKLYFKDIRSGEVIDEFTATDIMRYRNPFFFNITSIFSGLSLGLLMPFIYPLDTLSCGLHTESLLEDSISRMLTTLSEQVASSRKILAQVGKSYGADTWPTIKKSKTDIMSYLDSRRSQLDPIEGIWSCVRGESYQDMRGQTVKGDSFSQNDYEIAIIPKDYDGRTFVGIIISTTCPKWDYPGRIKAEFQATAHKGEYTVKWWNDDYQLYTSIFNIDPQGNVAGWFDYWSKFESGDQRKKTLLKLIKIYPPFESGAVTKPVAAPTASSESVFDRFLNSVIRIKNPQGAIGSGFFVNSDGLIVTNWHVVAESISTGTDAQPTNNYHKTVQVTTRSGQLLIGSVLAVDSKHDLALVSVTIETPCYLKLGSIANFKTGDEVIAIGAPESLEWSMSKGIVSAIRQSNEDMRTGLRIVHNDPEQQHVINPENSFYIVQTDAAINHGNSGGPLIDFKTGLVVGVNTWGYGRGDNLNFAVAADELKKAFFQYIK